MTKKNVNNVKNKHTKVKANLYFPPQLPFAKSIDPDHRREHDSHDGATNYLYVITYIQMHSEIKFLLRISQLLLKLRVRVQGQSS